MYTKLNRYRNLEYLSFDECGIHKFVEHQTNETEMETKNILVTFRNHRIDKKEESFIQEDKEGNRTYILSITEFLNVINNEIDNKSADKLKKKIDVIINAIYHVAKEEKKYDQTEINFKIYVKYLMIFIWKMK